MAVACLPHYSIVNLVTGLVALRCALFLANTLSILCCRTKKRFSYLSRLLLLYLDSFPACSLTQERLQSTNDRR